MRTRTRASAQRAAARGRPASGADPEKTGRCNAERAQEAARSRECARQTPARVAGRALQPARRTDGLDELRELERLLGAPLQRLTQVQTHRRHFVPARRCQAPGNVRRAATAARRRELLCAATSHYTSAGTDQESRSVAQESAVHSPPFGRRVPPAQPGAACGPPLLRSRHEVRQTHSACVGRRMVASLSQLQGTAPQPACMGAACSLWHAGLQRARRMRAAGRRSCRICPQE